LLQLREGERERERERKREVPPSSLQQCYLLYIKVWKNMKLLGTPIYKLMENPYKLQMEL
jgi:hypothetical protein